MSTHGGKREGSGKKKSNAGRPTVMTEVVLAKLEEAFSFGCPDREACIFAGISDNSLYDYCQEHPEFRERKEALKETPILKARATVLKRLEESYSNSMDFLKRKRKKEFGDSGSDEENPLHIKQTITGMIISKDAT